MLICSKCGDRFEPGVSVCPKDRIPLTDAPIGQVLAGKYRIEGLVKTGGMGAVYRATHLMLQKPIAVKLIKPELVTSQDTIQRFHREARAASQLNHPNIVTIHDLGQTEDGTLYIAMELVPGISLKELVKKEGPLQPDRAVRLAKAINSALSLAHRKQIIHRDLKPQNVMVWQDNDGREQPKLLDFGIAKTFESEGPALTSTGLVLGTPHYMSPEQAQGTAVDGRSDLYALGIILYEMLGGQVPFNDTSIPAILVKHLNEPPRPLTELRPDLDPALEAVVLRCLEKQPDKRYQNAEELAQALAAVESARGDSSVESRLPPISPSPERAAQTFPTPAANDAKAATESGSASHPSTQPTVRAAQQTSTQVAQAPKSGSKGVAIFIGLVALLLFALGGLALWGFGTFFGGRAENEEATASPVPEEEAPRGTPAMAPPASRTETIGTSMDKGGIDTGGASPDTSQVLVTPPPAAPPIASTTSAIAEPKQETSSPASSPAQVQPTPPPIPALPASPPVYHRCEGLSDACSSLKSALQQSFDRAGLPVAPLSEAEIVLLIYAEEIESRTEEQFGTTFVVRTYSVEASAEAPRFGEPLNMPPPEVFSFDTRFGRERLNERSRVFSAAVLQHRRRQGCRRPARDGRPGGPRNLDRAFRVTARFPAAGCRERAAAD